MACFLKQRTQRVLVEGVASDPVTMDSGVPQGTVLGPQMFLIFINDLPSDVSADSRVRLFADDCLLYWTVWCQNDQVQLQKDLTALFNWSKRWGMRFNAKKCEIMSITRAADTLERMYSLDGEV